MKQIHSCMASGSTNDRYVQRWIDLPFEPRLGLCISLSHEKRYDNDKHYLHHNVDIVEVHWKHDGQYFLAYTNSEKELYNRAKEEKTFLGDIDPDRLKEIVEEYVASGWTDCKPFQDQKEPPEDEVRQAMRILWDGPHSDNLFLNAFEYRFFVNRAHADMLGFTACGVKGWVCLCYRKVR